MEDKSPVTRKVSLKDVQEHTPAESDEDQLIMKEAEKVNPTTGSTEPISSFTAVPKSLESEGESPDDTSELKTVEDELIAATIGLNDLYQDDVTEVYTNNKEGGKEKSQTARFAGSAGHLFNRMKGSKAKVRDGNNTHTEALLMDAEEMGKKHAKGTRKGILLSMQDFRAFVSPSKHFIWTYIKGMLLFVIVPATLVAYFIYEVIPEKDLAMDEASTSWWILFLFVRQPITFGLPRAVQFIVVDYWFLHTQWAPRLFGPYITLFLVQSKGWPFHLTVWGVIDFMMLYGSGRFARHWMFYQDTIEVFSEENPAGEVLEAKVYKALLIFAIVLGFVVTAKRYYIGLSFGKATYSRYSEKLSSVLKDCLLVSNVAQISSKAYETEDAIEKQVVVDASSYLPKTPTNEGRADGRPRLSQDRSTLSRSEKKQIIDLLEDWEEIDLSDKGVEEPSISSIVLFRASVSYLYTDFPFSPAFGFVKTRVQMVDGAQEVYARLVEKQNDGDVLTFQTIAQTAVKKGKLKEETVKDLVRVFRPTRDGLLTLLDFCKSVDALYKDLRLLRVALANEAKMNKTSETMINAFFYFIVGCVFLSIIGIDPAALFAALAGFIVGFAFMIGGAASKYFEGVLMVLMRRPYDIGDRIAIQGAEDAPSSNGAPGWIVKDVSLYHTTVIYGASQEYATYSNGSLASSRIINANRSPRAVLSYKMRFGLSVETENVEKFKKLVEAFVKKRPREWLAFSAFRLTAISADLGFVEYITIVQHREGWHQIGALLTSLAQVQTYAFDLSQEMKMGYSSPSMPVELHVAGRAPNQTDEQAGAGELHGITSMLLGNP